MNLISALVLKLDFESRIEALIAQNYERPESIFNNQKGFERTSNQQSLIRRFNSLAEGSYKYNPFVKLIPVFAT
jgi:hypothetical protein